MNGQYEMDDWLETTTNKLAAREYALGLMFDGLSYEEAIRQATDKYGIEPMPPMSLNGEQSGVAG
jgi:hypothetical protein